MADQVAQVRSIDELDAFRSKLIVFQSKARKAVDQASEEVRRMRLWIDSDRLPYWEGQVKKRLRHLEQTQQELLSARMSEFVDNPVVQQQNVRKAKAALEEAEEKLRLVKQWNRNFETTVQPMVKKLEGVTGFIDFEIPQAIASMTGFIRTLDAYAERLAPKDGGDRPAEEPPATATEAPPSGS